MSFFTAAASGGDFIKFDDTNVGQPIEMEIASKYSVRPSVFDGEVRRTKKGEIVQESVIPVLVDGELMTLAVSKWRMVQAIGNAVVATGAKDLEIGGKLTLVYVGKEKSKYGQGMAQKFAASYVRAPEGAELATPDPEPAPAPAPAPQVDQFAGYPEPPADPWGNLR